MKILVAGAGGVGGYFGAKLAMAGADVSFLARGEHLKALKKNGLTLISQNKRHKIAVKAFNKISAREKFSVILFCGKVHQSKALLQLVKNALSSDGLIISLQNGLNRHVELQKVFGQNRVRKGFCVLGAFIEKPGVIRHVAAGKIILDKNQKIQNDLFNDLCKIVKKAKIDLELSPHFEKKMWEKFLWNIGFNGPTALTKMTVHDLLHTPDGEHLCFHLMREVEMIAAKKGIQLSKNLAKKNLVFSKKNLGGVITSMLVDRIKGRPLELEAFYQPFCRMAAAQDIPYNKMLLTLLEAFSKP